MVKQTTFLQPVSIHHMFQPSNHLGCLHRTCTSMSMSLFREPKPGHRWKPPGILNTSWVCSFFQLRSRLSSI